MPELPEVETVVRQIRPDVQNRKILDIQVYTPKLIRCQAYPLQSLVGCKIQTVIRRGKFIRVDVGDDTKSSEDINK